jgi:hypothetical protein
MTNSMPDRPTITATDAREAAVNWLDTTGQHLPGFAGAWLAGSVAWLPDHDLVQPWSDVDVMVVLRDEVPPKIGKLIHHDVLLEISFISAQGLAPGPMEANYRVSCSFVEGKLLADPSGELARVQSEMQGTFWTPESVRGRIAQARLATLNGVTSAPPSTASLVWQAMWVFPAGLPTHLILLGAGENPTVRRRYEKTLPILERVGRIDLYEALLSATGYADFTRSEVLGHWEATRTVFDVAAPHSASATPFFASDISEVARSISIDGTLASIEQGFHRETLFWLVATQSRSLAILEEVAPDLITSAHTDAFQSLVDQIGIATPADRAARGEAIIALLPELERVAHDLIDRNPTVSG